MRALPLMLLAVTSAACGTAPVLRWAPAPDASADRAVVFVSTECSGTLVAPSMVVTAAHCMEDGEPWTVRVDGEVVPVASCEVHPSAYGVPRGCGEGRAQTDSAHDLAVLTLEAPAETPVVPVLLTEPALRPDWWRNVQVRLVGWDRRPRIAGVLEQRSGTNRVVALRGASFETAPEGRPGFSTVIGDSGGPALVRIDGRERLLGVLFGGPRVRVEDSVYCATFHPENARWLLQVLPPEWGRDLPDPT